MILTPLSLVSLHIMRYGWKKKSMESSANTSLLPVTGKDHFRRLFLYREGLTFQDKLEIVRGLITVFGETAEQCKLKSLLKRIEEFKSWRNTLAHGIGESNLEETHKIVVEVVTRSGKEKRIEITPASHRKMLEETEKLLTEVQEARIQLREF